MKRAMVGVELWIWIVSFVLWNLLHPLVYCSRSCVERKARQSHLLHGAVCPKACKNTVLHTLSLMTSQIRIFQLSKLILTNVGVELFKLRNNSSVILLQPLVLI